jgi:hypothetical protein
VWNTEETLHIDAENGTKVTPVCETKLLGGIVRKDMFWKSHIHSGKDSLLKSVNRKIGALRQVSRKLSLKSKTALANGVIMSRLVYLISVWGGAPTDLIRRLQAAQNSAARMILGRGRRAKMGEILKTLGWLSVRQLAIHHSLIHLWKTVRERRNIHFQTRIRGESDLARPRRDLMDGRLDYRDGTEMQIVRNGWRWRSVMDWNRLPENLRTEPKLPNFKRKLKDWVIKNIATSR